jgi:tRNA threonylcarbamoyladenosine biosynthesis protein TsaB
MVNNRMKILAIDTATEACSAALLIDGDTVNSRITAQYQLAPREHSRLILKMIDDLLTEAGLPVSSLDAIAFGRGPGSFMGLRIAAGVVQGIAFAHDIPVIPVSTLKAIAQHAYEETGVDHVLVAIDARMDEVYWGAYYLGEQAADEPPLYAPGWLLDGEEQVISPDKIRLPEMLAEKDKIWVAAGTGWGSYADRLLPAENFTLHSVLVDCFPSAENIVKLAVSDFKAGNMVSASQAIPVYLRNDVAKKPKPVIL